MSRYSHDQPLVCRTPFPVRLSCPPRKDEADWLVELTGPTGDAYRASPAELAERGLPSPPVTAEEFHARWRESEMGKALDGAS